MSGGRLEGKVALVTGGTVGIGAAAVKRMAAEGAKVVFTGSKADVAAELEAAAPGSSFFRHSVTDVAGWRDLMGEIKSRYGRLDIAFANAGVNTGDSNIEEVTLEAWRSIIDINLTGTMLTCQHSIALMKQNPGGSSGSIIINSSITGMFGLPEDVTYSATKGAVRILSKSVALRMANAKTNIRCNSIHPGVIETPIMLRAIDEAPDSAAARSFLEGMSPLKRLGKPEEVAAAVVFLASDEASLITGSEMTIDGGTTSGVGGV